MSIDFVYAQARSQARLGDRLPEDGWRLLESSLSLPQYLASARGTVLAPRVEPFSAHVTPHTIERMLRRDWQTEVGTVSRWVPGAWISAVVWTTWVPYIEAIVWLSRSNPVLAWMRDDPMLAPFAVDDPAARRVVIADSALAVLSDDREQRSPRERWFGRWRMLWPPTRHEETANLEELIDAIRRYLVATDRDGTTLRDRRNARAHLVHGVKSIMHRHIEQPVVVFCHLVLYALDLQRLRDGLMRRALFSGTSLEHTA